MIVVLKGFFREFDVGISKYSGFESRQQPISVNFSDWGLAPLATVRGLRLPVIVKSKQCL